MSVCWEFGVLCYSYSYSCSCSVVGNRYWSKKIGNVGSLLLEPISYIGNGCVARDLALRQGASRENILHGSLSDEQHGRGGKDRQPFGLRSGERLSALLLSHRTFWLCSFVAPCQSPAGA